MDRRKLALVFTLSFCLSALNAAEFDSEPAVMSFVSVPFGYNAKNTVPTFGLALSLIRTTDHFNNRISTDLQQSTQLLKFEMSGIDTHTAKSNGLPVANMINMHSHQADDPRITTTEEKVLILGMGIAVVAGD